MAFADIFLDDCYGLGRWGRPVRTILDVGANVGLFSLAARLRYPDALIHAYEPDVRLGEYLIAQANVGRFEVDFSAIGRDAGFARLDRSADSVLNRAVTDASGDIPQVAFSEAVARLGGRVDLVKMDCEGAEWEILADAPAWRNVRAVAMEYHLTGGRKHADPAHVMASLGFEVLEHFPSEGCGIVLARRGAP